MYSRFPKLWFPNLKILKIPLQQVQVIRTGSPKKRETWKTTMKLLTDIKKLMKGPSININM